MSANDRPSVEFEAVEMVFTNGLRAPVHALDGFSMSVPQGAVVGLLGPNGSGKTTAISCMLGLLRPQRGVVRLWGMPIENELPAAADARVGVLLEDTRLPPFLSVEAALRTVCRVRGLHGDQERREFDRVVEQAMVGSLTARRVAVLSKGQARRVGLAAALLGDPPLLVLDEPSAGLDVNAREEFNALVRTLRDDTRTVLIASHVLGDIESTCTHVAVVRDGRVVLFATAEQLMREARARRSERDIYVEAQLVPQLEELGIASERAKYPGLVRLLVDGSMEPEHELMGRLAARRIVPARIEPRVSLVSVYLELTAAGSESPTQ